MQKGKTRDTTKTTKGPSIIPFSPLKWKNSCAEPGPLRLPLMLRVSARDAERHLSDHSFNPNQTRPPVPSVRPSWVVARFLPAAGADPSAIEQGLLCVTPQGSQHIPCVGLWVDCYQSIHRPNKLLHPSENEGGDKYESCQTPSVSWDIWSWGRGQIA